MTVQECYEMMGGNYETIMSRLRKEDFVERFMLKFTSDPSFGELSTCLEEGRTEDAFRAAHTLKGVCANLAMDTLVKSASEITEMLRNSDLESAREYFPKVAGDYTKAIDAIGKYQAEKE